MNENKVAGIVVPLKRINNQDFTIPKKGTTNSAGFDLYVNISAPITLRPMMRAAVSTGFCMAVPFGYEAQIRSRSGLSMNHGVVVLNAPGTIDADYRGEVKVLLINFGDKDFIVEDKMRIAQILICKLQDYCFVKSDELPTQNTRYGGFGSTGS